MKVLILGVGNAQLDAIEYLRGAGHEVHGLSYKAEGPGMDRVHHFAQINIVDVRAVARYARRHAIDLVYSVGSDVAMPTIGYVSQKLGLPHYVNSRIISIMHDKAVFREFCMKNNIAPVRYVQGNKVSDFAAWSSWPAIIKPVDSQGQRGVFRIHSQEELAEYLEVSLQYSRGGRVIVEEYIAGEEVSVNVFVRDGEVMYTFISDRRVLEHVPGGIPAGHDLPTSMPAALQHVANGLVERVVKRLGIENGPVYFQMKYNAGEVKIIEATPRLDGCHIWRLINLKHGVNLLDMTFNGLMSERMNPQMVADLVSGPLRLSFFTEKPGVRFLTSHFERGGLIREKFRHYYYHDNEVVRAVNGFREKVGYIIG